MFKVTQSPTFWATVRAEVRDENGKQLEVNWKQQFKRLPVSEVQAMTEVIQENKQHDADFLTQVTTDWKEVGDEDGNPLPCSEDELRKLVDAGFSRAMLDAFYGGYPKAKVKN